MATLETLIKNEKGEVTSYSIGKVGKDGFTGKAMELNGFGCFDEMLFVGGLLVGNPEDEWDDCVALFSEMVGLDVYSEIQNIESDRIDFNIVDGKFVYSEIVRERMI